MTGALTAPPQAQAPAPLVLIVEDEWLLAELLEATVRRCGFDVAGPAACVAEALAILANERITMAVLDVSLGATERSFPVARQLMLQNTPFVFVTGYQGADLPDEFRGQDMLSKPLSPDTVAHKLRAMLARSESQQTGREELLF